jgi:hypothetical protein
MNWKRVDPEEPVSSAKSSATFVSAKTSPLICLMTDPETFGTNWRIRPWRISRRQDRGGETGGTGNKENIHLRNTSLSLVSASLPGKHVACSTLTWTLLRPCGEHAGACIPLWRGLHGRDFIMAVTPVRRISLWCGLHRGRDLDATAQRCEIWRDPGS